MKYLSNVNRNHNCCNRFGKEYKVSEIYLCHFFSCCQHLKITKLPTRENSESRRKHFGSPKYPREKHFELTKYQEKKFWTHPREKTLEPRNNHEKKFRTHEIPTKA